MAGQAPTVDIGDARSNELGQEVLRLFDQRCGHLIEQLIEDRARGVAPGANASEMEIEARCGVVGDKGFRPGVTKAFFTSMRDHFLKRLEKGGWARSDDRSKLVTLTHTDHIDVVFQDGVRVTVALVRAPDGVKVDRVDVKAVITKTKLGRAADFRVRAPRLGDKLHLRIGVAAEEPVAADSPQYALHAASAEKAIMDAYNVSTRLKILGGIDLHLKRETPRIVLPIPPDPELYARGALGFSDPLFMDAARHDNTLDPQLARQLKWTLLQPAALPGLSDAAGAMLRKVELGSSVTLTNRPGVIALPNGKMYAAYACQYVIRVPFEFVLCGHGRFANPEQRQPPGRAGDFAADAGNLPINVFRRKKRWSFELRSNQRLDMTESKQSPSLLSLDFESPTFEVELEKTLSTACCDLSRDAPKSVAAALSAVAHADALLSDVASRIYGVALPPLDLERPPNAQWADQQQRDRMRLASCLPNASQSGAQAGPRGSYLRQESAGSSSNSSNNNNVSGAANGAEAEAMDLDADQRVSAGFYNQLDRSSNARRHDSLIYHMRCLNNFVKSVSMKEALRRALQDPRVQVHVQRANGIRVLDLACGKGADLRKMTSAAQDMRVPVADYVGVDIARNSLQDAVGRLQTMGKRARPTFRVRFIEADLGARQMSAAPGSEEDARPLNMWDSATAGAGGEGHAGLDDGSGAAEDSWKAVPPSRAVGVDERFDLVSMQFAMHYMFQTRARADHFFRSVSRHMRPGAVMLATTVCADEMVRKLMAAGPGANEFAIRDNRGVETCRVKFDPSFRRRCFSSFAADKAPSDATSGGLDGGLGGSGDPDEMMGIRYEFTLRDGDDDAAQAVNAPEWLIPLPLLIRLATAHCLRVVRYERLPTCAARHLEHHRADRDALFRKMNVLNYAGTLSDAEWEVASLYVVIELQREAPPEDSGAALDRLRERLPDYASLADAEKDDLLASLDSYSRLQFA